MVDATDVPLRTARLAVELMELAREVTESGNPASASDGAAGAELLAAACRGAVRNVDINAASIKDAGRATSLRSEGDELVARADDLAAATTEAFLGRLTH